MRTWGLLWWRQSTDVTVPECNKPVSAYDAEREVIEERGSRHSLSLIQFLPVKGTSFRVDVEEELLGAVKMSSEVASPVWLFSSI